MLRDMLELTKDAISKNPIISKVLLKKIFKFLPRHQIFGLRATLLLVPLLDHCPMEKRDGKQDPILSIGPGGFEMVFTLLVEPIVI